MAAEGTVVSKPDLAVVYKVTRLVPITTRKGAQEVWVQGREEMPRDFPAEGISDLGPEVMVGRLARAKLDAPRGELVNVDHEAWARMSASEIARAKGLLDGTRCPICDRTVTPPGVEVSVDSQGRVGCSSIKWAPYDGRRACDVCFRDGAVRAW